MRLYLGDEEKITSFSLPEKAMESFLFSYTSNITNLESFINIYSNNDAWFIKNKEDIEVLFHSNDVQLEEFKIYELKIKGVQKPLFLYTYPTYNENYRDIKLEGINLITIGSQNNNSIIYQNDYMDPTELSITFENGLYFISQTPETRNNLYVNGRIVTTKTQLLVGDTIFINNLKIIWMNNFFRIYSTSDLVMISKGLSIASNPVQDNSKFLKYERENNNKSLFREDDVFFHKPRLINRIEPQIVTIDSPGSKEEKDEIPLAFQIGASLAIGIYSIINLVNALASNKNGTTDQIGLILSISVSVILVIISLLLPKLCSNYNTNKNKKKEQIRQKKYNDYLDKKQGEVTAILNNQRTILYNNNPSSADAYNTIIGSKERLWERDLSDEDFLNIRLGLGNIDSDLKIESPKESFTINEDNLISRINQINNSSKQLLNVPITFSLVKNNISSIVYNNSYKDDYINGILLQILSAQSPKDLRIILLTNKKNEHRWQFMKLIPHILSDDKQIRYFATTEEEANEILKDLETIYSDRKEKCDKEQNEEINQKDDLYQNFDTYYLIITDDYKKYGNLNIINTIVSSKKNLGFSFLAISESLRNIPNESTRYVYITNESSVILEKDNNNNNQILFNPEIYQNLDMFRVSRELSNIPLLSKSDVYSLPTSISFLEMYNVGNIEQLNVLNRWETNNPVISLSCPIGVHPSGEQFKLDLHEKAYGPHGLIAGSTGSGKSEFIITFILSMAVNYSPEEVQFVIIDYKGGGLAGAFENKETKVTIPHLAGTITNLDVSEMNRALVSINSELKRRQRKFNEVRDKLGESTIDIYKYQKYYREGLIDEPISHLFIISDEFAELKSQQPEFMEELISTSRIGRSLGVHLILATQKPAGVVNDQIWSNSRFKVCLKVQTKSDSNEMLKRPEAATIKETGRFYLQVGYDELFNIGQAAWSGANYVPTQKVIKEIDDSINFVGNTGEIIKSANTPNTNQNKETKSQGDQLTNIVKYLNNISIKNNFKNKKLWLNSISPEIYLDDICKKYNYSPTPYNIEAVIGEYDNPEAQMQNILKLDITDTGNTLIYGMPGSGKENLLTTMITSVCKYHSVDEVMFYIMDFGAETLKKFERLPQVGDVALIDEKEKINNLIILLMNEINRRKDLFQDYMGSYKNYIKMSGKTLPSIICVIHGYENITENNYALQDKLYALFKDGPKFGINFIITNAISTGIRSRVLQMFNNKIALRLSNQDDYRYTVNAKRNLIPSNYFGRGISNINDEVYEFQTAYISKPDDINNAIIDLSKSIHDKSSKRAPKIPTLPEFLTVDKLLNRKYNLSSVPVGISKTKLNITNYDFTKNNFNPILSTDVNANIHFVYGLIELLKQISNTTIRVIDVLKIYNNSQGVMVYNDDFDKLTKEIKLATLNDSKLKQKNIFIIIGLGALKNNVSSKIKATFDDIFNNIKSYKNTSFIIYDDYNSYKSLEMEDWFRDNIDQTTGIWLGDNADNQLSIKMPNLTLDDKRIMFDQIGYIVKSNSHTIVRYVVDKEFKDEK